MNLDVYEDNYLYAGLHTMYFKKDLKPLKYEDSKVKIFLWLIILI